MSTKTMAVLLAGALILPAHAAPPEKAPVDVNVVNTPLPVSLNDSVYRVGLQIGWFGNAPAQVVDAYGTVTFPGPAVIEQVSGVCGNGVLAAFLSLPSLEALPDADNGVTVTPQVGQASIELFGLVPLPIVQTPPDYSNVTNWIAPVQMKLRVYSQIDVRVRKPQLYTGTDAWCEILVIARPASP